MTINTRMLSAVASVIAVLMLLGFSAQHTQAADPLKFNRLLKKPEEKNLPPPRDGIHDATIPAVDTLQPPRPPLSQLPEGKAGNYVDWVKALESGKINPRFDRLDPKAEPVIMNLDIVREVKGSMPDVVYPHKQHTEWLDCSNCHPAIFVPQKGANQISMASILLGQKCGVCHGKVAFPINAQTCRRCHSKSKEPAKAAAKDKGKQTADRRFGPQ